jgi:MtN3 and saliva related transmembrane protein
MRLIILIGLLAGALTTWGTLPQIIKALKTKKTTDVSLLMFLIIGTGVALWMIYGIFISDFPLILWNSI